MSQHTDYIYSINDKVILEKFVGNVLGYKITNNQIVDLPLTVSVKLISDTIVNNYDGHTSIVGNVVRCALQYRVLPNGEWTTVVNYNTKMETITESEPAKTYFGKNNIYPKGLKAGDAIMIRVYATDGMWQSGDLSSMCSNNLVEVDTKYGKVLSLPNTFNYNVTASSLLNVDLGGTWYPHLCCTVIYSGNERMIR
jgi:hypothetical protein